MSTVHNQGFDKENESMESLEMFHMEQNPLDEVIKEGQVALNEDLFLKTAILLILDNCKDNNSRLSLLTDIGLNTNDRCFALCEAIREELK